MIKFYNVEKKYQTDFWAKSFKALDELSFRIEKGALVGFLGANGAGKTTSIKILLKFIKANRGEVIYSTELGKNMKEIFSRIGYIPERPYFYPHLSGYEFLNLMGSLNDIPSSVVRQRIKEWGERFEITFALDRQIRSYSKGMLQRLGFVAALIHDPRLLILDEPLSGLDPMGRRDLKQALIELHKNGKTVFFSSHIVSDVEEICNKVVFLEKGKLVYEGSIDQLIATNIKAHYSFTLHNPGRLLLPGELIHSTADGLCTYDVPLESKDVFLAEALKQKINVLSMNPNRPSLEEIIYKIRS